MWIAVCDDDKSLVNSVSKTLEDITAEDDRLTFYYSGFDLLDAARKSRRPIDVLLLDIEMPGLTGIESARELREISPGTIIFIMTRFKQYAYDCYAIRAYDYILKPAGIEELKRKLDRARDIFDCTLKDVIHIETRQEDVFLPCGDIMYIESCDRVLCAHTRANKYPFYRTISQVSRELEGKGFFKVHKSFLINLSHVRRIDKSNKTVIMTDGSVVPAGARRMKELSLAIVTSIPADAGTNRNERTVPKPPCYVYISVGRR